MKEPSYASSDKRIIWLDLVKFIAIFMMIAVHCTDNVTPAERSVTMPEFTSHFFVYTY